MSIVSRSIVKVRRPSVIAWGVAILLATAAGAGIQVWRSRTEAAARALNQYHEATITLAQLKRNRIRIIRELARNKRLIAWREAHIEDAKGITADLGRQLAEPESKPLDEDVAQLCQLTIVEEEMNLARARKRRAQLFEEKTQIEQKIGELQVAIAHMVLPDGAVPVGAVMERQDKK